MSKLRSAPTPAWTRRRRHGRTRVRAAVAAAATLGLLVLGAAPAAAVNPVGTVSGTFTVPAGATSAPSDVYIDLVYANSDYAGNGGSATTVTSTSGSYSFANVQPGQYYVYFYDSNLGDNVQSDYYGDGGTDTIQSASLITVTAAQTTTVPGVALHAGATLSGTVTDANHADETSTRIYIYPIDVGSEPDPLIYEDGRNTVPSGTGAWSISGLPPGTYYVNYTTAGTLPGGAEIDFGYGVYDDNGALTDDYANATRFTLAAGASATANFSVPALGVISGSATGPHGPVSDDQVETFDGLGAEGAATDTAADGTYSMAILPGTYKVEFENSPDLNLGSAWYGGSTEAGASSVIVDAGTTVPNINVTFGPAGSISGTAVSAQGGAPVGGLTVDLLDAQGNYAVDNTYVYTQPDGTYTIPYVPAGTWYVRFDSGHADNGNYYAQEFYGGTPGPFGAAPVTVAAGQNVSGVNVALLPYALAPLGLPTATGAALSGLHNNKVALSFNLACGAGSGYLHTLSIGLPKGFSWNTSKLAGDLSLGSGVVFTDAVSGSNLVVTLASGQPSVAFTVKAGGIIVSKAVEKAAGGVTTKPKKHKKPTKHHKKKKHALASTAKAKKHKKKPKPAKPKDTIVSETINLSVSDMTGAVTSLPITINHPH